ncbi:MAG: ATP-dependent helicase [Thermodesulfobacteriota bacterium]
MQRSLFSIGGNEPAPPRPASRVSRAELNEAQHEAATTVNGPVLVIAGAGSGKTRTLIYRLAHLLSRGIAPESILLLTFTRKAAQEMLHRASLLLDDSCRRVMGGTFHAMANLLLRRHCRQLGYEPNFTIIDQSDSEGIVNLIRSSLNLGGDGKRFPSKRAIVAILSKSVNKGIPIETLMEEEYGHLCEFTEDVKAIGEHFQRFKLEHGLMDYDDLLTNWRRLLAEFPEARDEIAGRFSHIMVDEYQDTNPVQAAIVRLMASGHDNVMAVGDDSQSIYSFRGADFRNIMEFPNLFPGTRLIRLEENYRSTQRILDLTNAVIERAAEKYAKTLFTSIAGGEAPVVCAAPDESAQARYVAARIEALRDAGTPLAEIAVLFRSGYHSYKLELELASRRIDFDKRGGLRLTESSHIKDVLSFLRVVDNPQDHLSWNRLLLQLEKVGPKTARAILERIRGSEEPLAALRAYPAGPSWRAGFTALLDMLDDLARPGLSVGGMFELVMEHYEPVFQRLYPDDYPKRRRDLEQLGQIMAGYESLRAFLDDATLDPPEVVEGGPGAGNEKMVLSTIHSAKGLEWDTVFVINLAEGKFPSSHAVLPEQLEEERRLLYVAATRARKELHLVYPEEVASYDARGGSGRAGVSPFLKELPGGLTRPMQVTSWGRELGGRSDCAGRDDTDSAHAPAWRSSAGPAIPARTAPETAPPAGATDLPQPGMRVRHPFFGEGLVERTAGPRSVDVRFARYGRKTLHLDYARLEILS